MRSRARRWRELLAAVLLVVLTALAAAEATAGGHLLTDGPGLVLVVLTAVIAGVWSPRLLTAGAVVIGAGFMTIASQAADPGAYAVADDVVFSLMMLGCPALFGAVLADRRREVRELTRLSTIRAGQVRAAVQAASIRETNRIASAVQHDVVQTLGAIVVRAEGALRTTPSRDLSSAVVSAPDATREVAPTTASSVHRALEEIEGAARTTLDQLRDHIGVLRTAAPGTSQDPHAAEATRDPRDPGRTSRWSALRPRTGRSLRVAPPALGRTDLLAALTALPICVEVGVTDVASGPAGAAVLAPAVLAAPLAMRRRHPLGAAIAFMLVSTAIGLALVPLDGMVTPILPTVLVAYAVGAHHDTWAGRLVGLVVMVAGALALAAVDRQASDPGSLIAMGVLLALAVAAGAATAASAARVQAMNDLVRSIERHRDDEVRLVTERQRHTIARDLHDSVASAATIICLQASAAQVLPDGRDRELTDAMRAIADTARTALREVRSSLDLVEATGPVATDGTLDAVLAAARRVGLDVSLVAPTPLPDAVAKTATRVVRECLVNASRYAPGARVVVSTDVTDGHVDLTVQDDGARRGVAASPGTGTGLVGLRERLGSIGGSLSHGPTAAGGYAVRATLPLPPVRGSAETSTAPAETSPTPASTSPTPAGDSATGAGGAPTGVPA